MRIAAVWSSAVQVAAIAAVVTLVACNSDRATSAASPSLGGLAYGSDNGWGNPHLTDDSGCAVDVPNESVACTVGIAGLGNQGFTYYQSENAIGQAGFKAVVDAVWSCEHIVDNVNVDVDKTVGHKHQVFSPSPHVSNVLEHNGAVYFAFSDDLNINGNVGDCPPSNGNSIWITSELVYQSGWKLAACYGNQEYGFYGYLGPVTGGDLANDNSLNGDVQIPC
jgi:hypothetical protein